METHITQDPGWACAQTVYRFFRCLDENRVGDAVSLFTEEGVWIRRGNPIQGHSAILSALSERPTGRITRHLISNLIADDDCGHTVARYDVTIYSLDGPVAGVVPLPLPHTLLTCEDRLMDTALGWRFVSRSSRVIFAAG